MPVKVGEIYEELVVKDNTGPALATAERNFGQVGSRLDMLKGAIANLGIGALGVEMTRTATEFNAGMANVGSLIPGNTARVKELAGEVQALRVQLGLTGQDATTGLYQAISAFGDTADTMKIMEINAKAARAGVASVSDAINLTSAVTKAYGDTSAQAVEQVSDLALMTVRLGQTTFPELAASIGRVTPLTKALGVSQQELFAVMATATGVTGGAAEVSTQLRGVLQSLMSPTDSMAKLMQSLGYANGEAMIKALGMSGTIKAITDAANASGQPLQEYISSIEGQTLALALAGPQADTFTAKLEQMQQASGSTNAAFKEQAEGVNWWGHQMARAREAWNVFLEKVGIVGPLLTAGASIAQLVTVIRSLAIPARVANTAAITAETAALTANTAAAGQNAAAQGAAAAAGRAGMLARAGGAVGGALTAIGGTVGVGGGLAGLGVAGLYGLAAAGIAAVGYEIYGIIKYSRDAAKATREYKESLKQPGMRPEDIQARVKADRARMEALQKEFGVSKGTLVARAKSAGMSLNDYLDQLRGKKGGTGSTPPASALAGPAAPPTAAEIALQITRKQHEQEISALREQLDAERIRKEKDQRMAAEEEAAAATESWFERLRVAAGSMWNNSDFARGVEQTISALRAGAPTIPVLDAAAAGGGGLKMSISMDVAGNLRAMVTNTAGKVVAQATERAAQNDRAGV